MKALWKGEFVPRPYLYVPEIWLRQCGILGPQKGQQVNMANLQRGRSRCLNKREGTLLSGQTRCHRYMRLRARGTGLH